MTTTLKYEMGAVIGQGPIGVVRSGVDADSGAAVALKIVRSSFADDPHWVSRLVNIRARLNQVDHTGVVGISDLLFDEGVVTIVTDYVGGGDLRRMIESDEQVSPFRAARIIGEVLSALAAAHAAGVVHGDLRAENVLIGSDNEVRITDFALASLGRHRAISSADDVAAAGALLHELLTGATHASDADLAASPPDGLPVQLWEQLRAMVAPDPDTRPSAEDARLRLAALSPRLMMIAELALSPTPVIADPVAAEPVGRGAGGR